MHHRTGSGLQPLRLLQISRPLKPSVLVTRRIPSSALTRLEAVADVDLSSRGDLPHDDLIARIAGKQGLLSVVTDSIDRAVLEAGRDLKVVSTIAVGYNNIDIAAARERGRRLTALSRRRRRPALDRWEGRTRPAVS